MSGLFDLETLVSTNHSDEAAPMLQHSSNSSTHELEVEPESEMPIPNNTGFAIFGTPPTSIRYANFMLVCQYLY